MFTVAMGRSQSVILLVDQICNFVLLHSVSLVVCAHATSNLGALFLLLALTELTCVLITMISCYTGKIESHTTLISINPALLTEGGNIADFTPTKYKVGIWVLPNRV